MGFKMFILSLAKVNQHFTLNWALIQLDQNWYIYKYTCTANLLIYVDYG